MKNTTCIIKTLMILDLLLSVVLKLNGNTCDTLIVQIKDTVCAGEIIDITVGNDNFITLDWDFCSGDLSNSPSNATELGSVSTALNNPDDFVISFDGKSWYGFIVNYSSSDIVKLYFGNSINNSPSVENIGNFGGSISNPRSLDLIQIDSMWYGLVCNENNTLTKLSFGNNLDTVVDFEVINLPGILNVPDNIDIILNNDTVYAFLANVKKDSVIAIMFTDTFALLPEVFYIAMPAPLILPSLNSIKLIKNCERWYGFCASQGDSVVYQLDFGNSLSNIPGVNKIIQTDSPRDIEVVYDNGLWLIFIINSASGELTRIELGSDLSNLNPNMTNLGKLGIYNTSQEAITLVSQNSVWSIFSTNYVTNKFSVATFPDSCNANLTTSSEIAPTGLNYNKSGKYYIDLIVVDTNVNYYFSDSVYVKPGPIAAYGYSSVICKGNIVKFTDSSYTPKGSIKTWIWRFENGDSLFAKDTLYVFNTVGVNNVSLSVFADSFQCSHTLKKNLTILEKPLALFSTSALCVNDTIQFSDITVKDTLINVWVWNFGNGKSSQLKNPYHLYSDTGKFQITFITGVEGCTDTIIDTITFYPKPIANFSSTDICFSNSTKFNDSSSIYLSSLTPINKWNWDLGDSKTDLNQFPKHVYADSGKYQVSLIVTTSKNCSDTISNSIDILKPLAKFLIKEKICDNFPIPFIDTSTVNADSIISWKWSFVSGDSSVLQYPTYSFPDSGTFNIYLKVTSSQNCIHDTVIPIYVNFGPSVSFSFDTVCAESPTSFSDNSTIVPSDTIISWTWNFGDSSAIGTSQNTQHIYSDGAQYSVTLNVTTQKGCKGIKIKNVIVKPLPVVNFGYSTVCVNNNVDFYDYSSVTNVMNDSIVSWKWFFDDGNSSTSQNPINLYASSTTKNVLLVAFTSNNCFDSVIKPVIINPLPIIDYTYTEVCEPETTSFSSSSSLYNLYWIFGDPTSGNKNKSTEINPTHLYKIADNYFVNLIAVSNDNCTTKVNKTVGVSHIPTANFITDSICHIFPANFFDSSFVAQASITEWKWDFDDGTSLDTIQNPTHSFSDTGKYTISLIVFSEKGCSSEVSKNIQVFQLPDAKFDFTPQFGIPPLNVSFKNKTNEAISYKWYFGDGDTSLEANPSHAYTDTGNYRIVLSVINEYGCVDTLYDLIRVKKPVLDLIVNELLLKLKSNYYETTVNFTNIGNRDIETINFELEFVNGSTVLEEWTGSLLPSKNDTYIFSSKTKSESLNQSDVVCVSATLINYEQDDKPDDNKQCVTLNKEIDILSPIYDYENNTVILQIISNKEQSISINFYDRLGKILYKGNVSCNEGYNTVDINVARQQAGLYIYTINNDNELITGKVTILN